MSDLKKNAARRPAPISVEEFDRRAEAGEDLDEYFDWSSGVMIMPGELSPGQKLAVQMEADAAGQTDITQSANSPFDVRVSLPSWAFDRLKTTASSRGITYEDLAQILIVQQLEKAPA